MVNYSIVIQLGNRIFTVFIPIRAYYRWIKRLLKVSILSSIIGSQIIIISVLYSLLGFVYGKYTTFLQDRREFLQDFERLNRIAEANDIYIDQSYGTVTTPADLNKSIEYTNKQINLINRELFYKKLVLEHTPSMNPLFNSVVCSGYGYRTDPINGEYVMHWGLDIVKPSMPITFILAPGDGIIETAGVRQGYGSVIVIDHLINYKTKYYHCSSINVRKGQPVKRGQIIGVTGSTGRATGVHLHYEAITDGHNFNPRFLIE